MSGGRLIIPNADPIYSNGVAAVGAVLTVYLTGTTTPAILYADGSLSTAITNPQVADSAGLFYDQSTSIYLNTASNYDVTINCPNGQTFSYENVAVQPSQVDLSGYAPINSPAFTGTPTAPTPASNDTSSKIATTQFVATALAASTVFNASVIASSVSGCIGINTSSATQNSNWTVKYALLPSATVGQNPLTITNFSGTLYLTGSLGLNGLDAGSLAASTFYYVWLITNGTTPGLLASTSSSSPTLPTGYGFKALIGVLRTDTSSNTIPFMFSQNRFDYITSALQLLTSASTGGSWTNISVSNWVPTGAVRVRGTLWNNNNTINAAVAPINPTTFGKGYSWVQGGSNGGADNFALEYDLPLVTQAIWYASTSGNNSLYITGFNTNF